MNRWTQGFLLALRIAVGWHFLYEGVFKMDSHTGAVSYSPARYTVQSATERLRMALNQTPGEAYAHLDRWNDEIVKAFSPPKALDEGQKSRLAAVRDELKLAYKSGEPLPEIDWAHVHAEVLKFAPEPPGEEFSSLTYLQSSAGPMRRVFRGLVSDMDGLERLTAASAQARIDARYKEVLEHFAGASQAFTPEQKKKLLAVRDALKKSITVAVEQPAFQARIADYRNMLARIREDERHAVTPFARERLDADRKKLDAIAAEMLAVVNEPMSEMAVQAHAIATPVQLGAGPLPRPASPSAWVDRAIQWSLIAIGVCLMLGLFTPVAGLAAAGQLAMFYLASPPWPGMPAASLGGHYLYVDRNLIEMIAAVAVATAGTGKWAGLDAYLKWPARREEQQLHEEEVLVVGGRS